MAGLESSDSGDIDDELYTVAGVAACGYNSVPWEWSVLSTEAHEVFVASQAGDVVSLKLLLNDSSNASQLLLQVGRDGRTALHWALNRDTAQVLVESVEPTKLRKFLWVSEDYHGTALDAAVVYNRADIVEYLCGLTSADESLLDGHLFLGHQPLHLARSVHIARILVESVPSDKLTTLLLHTDSVQQTALHAAVSEGCNEVVEYLCCLSTPQVLLQVYQNIWGNTALHKACTKRSVQLLVEFLPESMRRDFVYLRNNNNQTALHNIVQWWYTEPAAVKCYINTVRCADELLYVKDSYGRTALHYVSRGEIACLLIDAAQDKVTYINITDNEGRTALHCAGTGEIASLLIDAAQDKVTYINITDNEGRTALHYAGTGEIASLLIDAAQDKVTYINITDNEGNTAVMYMVEHGAIDVLQFTLECMDIEEVNSVLLMTNKKKQNILHLACISPLVEDFYEVLEEYLDYVKMEDLFTADIYNNTPFTYLVARFCTRIFAHFILKVPLHQRQHLLLQENNMSTSCQLISEQNQFNSEFYMQEVLCNSGNVSHWDLFKGIERFHTHMRRYSFQSLLNSIDSPEEHFKYDKDLYKVMLYALNIYSLQDLHISTYNQAAAGTCKVQRYHREQTDGRSKKALPPPILLYFDVDRMSLKEIQRQLYELDVPDRHSGLKVIVVRCSTSDLVRYLSPPGPDFIIITLVSVHSDCDMLLDLQTKAFKDVEDLLGYLKSKEGVRYININSTMGKNYGKPRSRRAEDVMLLSGASKGKALIICNRTDREKWEIEHEHACRVLGEQLGLQVECLYDKSADDMLTAISEFSKTSGHGSLTALSIMSHGDLKDKICGDVGKGFCSVQQVVDALCQLGIQSVTKMIFLSFCRGELGSRINRTYDSWESTDLKDTVLSMLYNPIRAGVTQDRLDSMRQRHPFPSVDVPLNCYICYSTLPDTMDFRWNTHTRQANKMFDCLSEHLTNIYKYNTLYKTVDSTHTLKCISSSEQDVAVSTQQLPRVELIPLLIDVTGIVKEKSGFTQYMNLCYAIDKSSKPLVVEILPAGNI